MPERTIDTLLDAARRGLALDADIYDLLRRSYDPSQPRWPKGVRGAGQWRPAGGSRGGADPRFAGLGVFASAPKLLPVAARSRGALAASEVERLDIWDDYISANRLQDWPEKDGVADEVLGGADSTQELHGAFDPAGNWVPTAEREAEHERIYDQFLRQRAPDGSLDPNGAPLGPPPDGRRRALFMAGGTASGKSSAVKQNPELTPPNAVVIDPDEIKGLIPEYAEMKRRGSKYAATAVHEESSMMAKQLRKRAEERGLNLVIDGTGNSRPGKFTKKITDAHDNGYEVDVLYVDAPTNVAVQRATKRALEEGRWVPEPEIRTQHAKVSINFPDVQALPFLRSLRVYDTTEFGQADLVAEGGTGSLQVHDWGRMREFLVKANEQDTSGVLPMPSIALARGDIEPDALPPRAIRRGGRQYPGGIVPRPALRAGEVPPERWVIERPFDSSEYLEAPDIKYPSEGGQAVRGARRTGDTRVDRLLREARSGASPDTLNDILSGGR